MKNFLPIWISDLTSSIASGMTAFAIAVYIFQTTGSVTLVSLATLLAFLPMILLNPLGGVFADRYDRRLLMVFGDSFSALGLIFIFISIQKETVGVFLIMLGLTISSIFISLLEPAYKATVTDLLSEEEYAQASGLMQIAASSKYLISPFLAGLLLIRWDVRLILIIDMATIFVTIGAIHKVRKNIPKVKAKTEKWDLLSELKAGFKSITDNKGVRSLVVLMAFMCFLVGFIQTLMVPMVLAFSDPKTLGIIESISAIGMLVGSIIIGALSIRKRHYKVLILALMIAGVFMALTGTTTNIWLIIVFAFVFFATLPFINTSADVLIRIQISNDLQGRAWGMISILTQIGYVGAYAVSGLLADFVFSPLLVENGKLVGSIGKLIGVGEGRGIGFMLVIAGFAMVISAFFLGQKPSIKELERCDAGEFLPN